MTWRLSALFDLYSFPHSWQFWFLSSVPVWPLGLLVDRGILFITFCADFVIERVVRAERVLNWTGLVLRTFFGIDFLIFFLPAKLWSSAIALGAAVFVGGMSPCFACMWMNRASYDGHISWHTMQVCRFPMSWTRFRWSSTPRWSGNTVGHSGQDTWPNSPVAVRPLGSVGSTVIWLLIISGEGSVRDLGNGGKVDNSAACSMSGQSVI